MYVLEGGSFYSEDIWGDCWGFWQSHHRGHVSISTSLSCHLWPFSQPTQQGAQRGVTMVTCNMGQWGDRWNIHIVCIVVLFVFIYIVLFECPTCINKCFQVQFVGPSSHSTHTCFIFLTLSCALNKTGTLSSLLHLYPLHCRNSQGWVAGLPGLYPSQPRGGEGGFVSHPPFVRATPVINLDLVNSPWIKARFYPLWHREDLVGRGSVTSLLNNYKVVTQWALRGIKSLQ